MYSFLVCEIERNLVRVRRLWPIAFQIRDPKLSVLLLDSSVRGGLVRGYPARPKDSTPTQSRVSLQENKKG